MIHDVSITPLQVISDNRGAVLHSVRSSDKAYIGFVEQYFSEIKKDIIKGWKMNKSIDQIFTVPHGDIKLVLFDNRPKSMTKFNTFEILIGRSTQYSQVKIPKNIWYAFKGISKNVSLVSNLLSLAHEDCLFDTMPLTNSLVTYSWG